MPRMRRTVSLDNTGSFMKTDGFKRSISKHVHRLAATHKYMEDQVSDTSLEVAIHSVCYGMYDYARYSSVQ